MPKVKTTRGHKSKLKTHASRKATNDHVVTKDADFATKIKDADFIGVFPKRKKKKKKKKKMEGSQQRNRLRLRPFDSKWVSTVASIWIQCTSGSLYTFSIYSQTLKTTQGYDQSTLDTVSVFKDFGANCGVLSGLLYSCSATWRVLWLVLLAGAAQCFSGYFLMWAAVAGVIPRPPVPVMCLFMFVAAHAMSFFNTSSAVTGVRNFPYYKGTIVGIMKVLAISCFFWATLFVSLENICFSQWRIILLMK